MAQIIASVQDLNIAHGPSRELVRDALGGLSGHCPTVRFVFDISNRDSGRFILLNNNDPVWLNRTGAAFVDVTVTGLNWIDDSRKSCIIRGTFVLLFGKVLPGKFKARYNTDTRKGAVCLSVKKEYEPYQE